MDKTLLHSSFGVSVHSFVTIITPQLEEVHERPHGRGYPKKLVAAPSLLVLKIGWVGLPATWSS